MLEIILKQLESYSIDNNLFQFINYRSIIEKTTLDGQSLALTMLRSTNSRNYVQTSSNNLLCNLWTA